MIRIKDNGLDFQSRFSFLHGLHQLVDNFSHPDHREISGVKLNTEGTLVYVICLSGTLTILKLNETRSKLILVKSVNCQKCSVLIITDL